MSLCKGRGTKSCKNYAILGKEYCRYHDYPVCQGVTKAGQPCGSRRRINSLYCRDSHDPGKDYTDPKLLRIDGLRNKMMDTVKEYRGSTDPYRGVLLPEVIDSTYELDHVTENHIFTGVVDRIHIDRKKKDDLLEHMRDNCLNERENLVFTTTEINNLKFKACDTYFTDYKEGIADAEGIFKYLQDEGKMSRRISGNVNREIVNSYDFVMDRLESERHDALMEELHDCFVIGMKLK